MHIEIKDNADNCILKLHPNVIKKMAVQHMYVNHPRFANAITSKMINNTMNYLQGYFDALSSTINQPIVSKEYEQYINSIAIKHILSQL